MSSESPSGVYGVVRRALITGAAVVVPIVITFMVLSFVFNFLYTNLSTVTSGILAVTDITTRQYVVDVAAVVFLVALVFVVGVLVERSDLGAEAVETIDDGISLIPGVGSIYDSFRQMSDVMMRSEEQNFRDVKVVEFPDDEIYTLGFLTTRTPSEISTPTPHPDMVTLFLPLAPNPVMGGHLVHVPEDRVIDVEMSVEEAMQTVVTTGVALGGAEGREGLSTEELRNLSGGSTARHDTLGDDE